jgi:DNA processing protein
VSSGEIAVIVGAGVIGPARLRRLFAHHTPHDAIERLRGGAPLHPMVVNGLPPESLKQLREKVRAASVADAAAECGRLGVEVVALGDPHYPAPLVHDPEAPPALFVRGDLHVLADRRVGIVGTRHASAAGRATAAELGAALSAASVAVISGLARGIDAAAHRGIRAEPGPGRAVAVVGSGPDVHYPKPNADLWEWVAETGLLISEWPPGVPPDAWRFPQRNRILAALSEILVVVESRERGGSLITARAAADRGIEVMAVPGSPRSRASAGTNQLLVDGVAPLTCVDDVLVALGLDHRRQGLLPFDARRPPDELQRRVLEACEREPSNLDMIVSATGLSVTDAALAAARLERSGWLAESGGWFEPVGSRLGDR